MTATMLEASPSGMECGTSQGDRDWGFIPGKIMRQRNADTAQGRRGEEKTMIYLMRVAASPDTDQLGLSYHGRR
jgi:hypothetical protein